MEGSEKECDGIGYGFAATTTTDDNSVGSLVAGDGNACGTAQEAVEIVRDDDDDDGGDDVRGSTAEAIVAKAKSIAVAKSSCPPPKLGAAPKKILKCRPHSQEIQDLNSRSGCVLNPKIGEWTREITEKGNFTIEPTWVDEKGISHFYSDSVPASSDSA